MTRRIYSVKSLLEKKYHELELAPQYQALMGNIATNCLIMCYGPSTSGKTTFALKLAIHLAELQGGKVLYDSHEEGINQSVQQRVKENNITYTKLYFGDKLSHEERMHKIKRNHYRVVVIDSVQYAQLTQEQLKEMRETFRKRKLIFILVSFGTSAGNTKGANDMLHDSDVKLYISQGKLTAASRYKGEQVETRLFSPRINKGQADLFTNTQTPANGK